MPVRHCQKCGLKVLVDEAQQSANPFYCQRCEASVGGDTQRLEGGPPGGEAPKAGPVKVVCPFCRGGFSGRIPSKPAKGSCPICRKELVLLPTGEIVSAESFDSSKRAGAEPTTDDQLQAAKRAIEMTKAREVPEEPEPEIDRTVVAPPPPLPLPPPPKIEEPPPPPPPPPTPPPPPLPAVMKATPPKTIPKKAAPPTPTAPPAPARGIGKAILAAILFFLPLGAGGAMWKLREGSLRTVVGKLGGFGEKGLLKVYGTLRRSI